MTVFDRLKLYEIDAMANNQGNEGKFTFYTLDKEPPSHYPHVHICIKQDKKYQGKLLRNNSPYMTLGSIKLRADDNYTLENLEFETIYDESILTTRNKKLFLRWLLSSVTRKKLQGILNCWKCVDDYLNNNQKCQDRQAYEDYLNN